MIKRLARKFIMKLYWSFNSKVIAGYKTYINLHSEFEGGNKLGDYSSLTNVKMGYGSYTGDSVHFNGVQIGRYCSIGNNVKNIIGNHPTKKYVSTHPAFFSVKKQSGFTYVDKQKYDELLYIDENDNFFNIIGNDVWIADDVSILSNVKISDGVIIGAKSLVIEDCLPYGIYAGIPAKLIRFRFSDDIIAKLSIMNWWNKDEKWIKENSRYFDDVDLFMKHVEEN